MLHFVLRILIADPHAVLWYRPHALRCAPASREDWEPTSNLSLILKFGKVRNSPPLPITATKHTFLSRRIVNRKLLYLTSTHRAHEDGRPSTTRDPHILVSEYRCTALPLSNLSRCRLLYAMVTPEPCTIDGTPPNIDSHTLKTTTLNVDIQSLVGSMSTIGVAPARDVFESTIAILTLVAVRFLVRFLSLHPLIGYRTRMR